MLIDRKHKYTHAPHTNELITIVYINNQSEKKTLSTTYDGLKRLTDHIQNETNKINRKESQNSLCVMKYVMENVYFVLV